MQLEAVPFQTVLPYYAVQGISVTYHDIFFNRDKTQFSVLRHSPLSLHLWLQLISDVADGLKYIHNLELVYRDLKSDNIALYENEGYHMHAVIIDIGKCVPASSCVVYSLSSRERQTYHQLHWHISPDLVDGRSKPFTASDIFSLERIIKQAIHYGTVDLKLWPKSIMDFCKQCLNPSPSTRPTITEILHVLNCCLNDLK